jgi:hypothetical protein
VLKISGLPCFARASSSVSTQNAASIVIDTRHDSTRRENQSSTTATLADALSTALAILPAVEAPRLLGSDCRAFLISGHGPGGVWL